MNRRPMMGTTTSNESEAMESPMSTSSPQALAAWLAVPDEAGLFGCGLCADLDDGHIPFLEQIAAAPDDEAAKLVYADWLEERGHAAADNLRRAAQGIRRL